MCRRFIKGVVVLFLVGFVAMGCVTVKSGPKKPKTIKELAGRTISYYSVTFDAYYDSRLDDLIPGYKVVSVLIRNLSLRPVILSAEKDLWVIVGEKGKSYPAIINLREKDPVTWRKLPKKLRKLIEYPEIVPVNYSGTFDLVFPKSADLEYFSKIRHHNAVWNQKFLIQKEY